MSKYTLKINSKDKVKLKMNRLILRSVEAQDTNALFKYRSDSEVNKFKICYLAKFQ